MKTKGRFGKRRSEAGMLWKKRYLTGCGKTVD
jgi:hypothetical protein